jgi:hypothetical protein
MPVLIFIINSVKMYVNSNDLPVLHNSIVSINDITLGPHVAEPTTLYIVSSEG